MMLNSDVAQTKETINVLLFMMVNEETSSDFYGINQAFSKAANERITFTLEVLYFFPTATLTYNRMNVDMTFEFTILLMHSSIQNYSYFIKLNFHKIFPDQFMSLIFIVTGTMNMNKIFNDWASLTVMGYYNVYAVLHKDSTTFLVLRTYLKRNDFAIDETQDIKYMTIKNLPEYPWTYIINTIYYDSYPMSYYRNGKFIGVEGQLIEEFSKKINIPYQVINPDPTQVSYQEASKYLVRDADICLSSNIHLLGRNFDRVLLNEIDGLCVLTPRNIPVSLYDNLTLPLDALSLVLSFVSTVSVILSWKIISIYTANERSLKSITIAVIEIIFNIGASGIEQLTKKEIVLVYSFIFSSVVLISFYESFVLAFILVSPTWRSAHDLTELNDSGATFFTFYTKELATFSSVPFIREELIQNKLDLTSMSDLIVPESFDKNLVYLVTCNYADLFVRSMRNIDEDRKIFDVIKITEMFKGYPIRKGFQYANEFKQIVENLVESGIYKFWQQKSIQPSLSNSKRINIEEQEYFDMKFPLILLITGCSISFLVFLYENFISRWKSTCMNRIGVIQDNLQHQQVKRKLKLTKWMSKYIYKKKLSKSSLVAECSSQFHPINHAHETIKCREKISGGYFVIKKMKKIRRTKKLPKIIQVRPYLENQTVE